MPRIDSAFAVSYTFVGDVEVASRGNPIGEAACVGLPCAPKGCACGKTPLWRLHMADPQLPLTPPPPTPVGTVGTIGNTRHTEMRVAGVSCLRRIPHVCLAPNRVFV